MFLRKEKKNDSASSVNDSLEQRDKTISDSHAEGNSKKSNITQIQSMIDNSARMVAQRKQNEQLFGKPIQKKKEKEEEKPVQKKKDIEEEKPVQKKKDKEEEEPLQRQTGKEEDKSVAMKSTETGLPGNLKKGVENLSGVSMDEVTVHYNSSKPAEVQALAYAQGTEIHLGAGQEKHLPHEAWHVAQQKQGRVNPTVQMKGVAVNDDASLEKEADVMGQKAMAGVENASPVNQKGAKLQEDKVAQLVDDKDDPKKKRLAEIEAKYRAMIKSSRERGCNVAADMLQRFIDGVGGTATLGVGWLRSFSEVTDAEDVNKQRFEKTITAKAYAMKDGERLDISDHWDRLLKGDVMGELFYASGFSTLTSNGNFSLVRKGNLIFIDGFVQQFWHDVYNWNTGLDTFVYIPGHGIVSDADGIFLQENGKAKAFNMESNWDQYLHGIIEIADYWPDSVNFDWKGP